MSQIKNHSQYQSSEARFWLLKCFVFKFKNGPSHLLPLLSSRRFTASVLVLTILIFAITQIIWVPNRSGAQKLINSLPRQRSRPHASYPIDLNWRSSLLYKTNVRDSGARFSKTEKVAQFHHTIEGMLRQYPRIHVLLRYTACQGLFNQMYAHLSAFVLAELLKADVVMPPSFFRPVRLMIIYLGSYFQCSNIVPS